MEGFIATTFRTSMPVFGDPPPRGWIAWCPLVSGGRQNCTKLARIIDKKVKPHCILHEPVFDRPDPDAISFEFPPLRSWLRNLSSRRDRAPFFE
jgi:hypothetical protein